jgi:hypothetical protein
MIGAASLQGMYTPPYSIAFEKLPSKKSSINMGNTHLLECIIYRIIIYLFPQVCVRVYVYVWGRCCLLSVTITTIKNSS